MIKNIIESRIRPGILSDGGDILFMKYVNNIVYVKLIGACIGCESSQFTLKFGVEKLLIHYIPEIKSVELV